MDNNQGNNPQQLQVEEEEDDNRANAEDDDEEDDDDDEPMEEEDDDEDGAAPEEEDTLEGGVADGGGSDSNDQQQRSLASEADIVLYFQCTEHFKEHPGHPILKSGIKVRIGMGKNTRLSAVMQRYVDVCNGARGINNSVLSPIELGDLEFVHAAVLKGQDTAEQGALMKDDIVRVRQNRWEENERERENIKRQRESDLVYFDQMRQAMDKTDFETVVLDCQGPPLPFPRNAWYNVMPKSTTNKVHCDAAIASKRCSWLGNIIKDAASGILMPAQVPADDRAKSVVSLPEQIMDGANNQAQRVQENYNIPEDDDLDVHPIQVLDFDPRPAHRGRLQQNADALAAQIESDDADLSEEDHSREGSPRFSMEERQRVVVIPNHAPEAVRLLLEYCYTNRVVVLGHEAFRLAARTKPSPRDFKGNLPPPGTKRWANRGEPTIPFEWAAAGISLAEEANMPRFSLMCEVAASHLVTPQNVVEALALCKQTQDMFCNPLQRLRRAAMDIVFHSKSYGQYDSIYKQLPFKESVERQAPLLVPTLFHGTADAVEESLGSKRYHAYRERDWKTALYERFRRNDNDDKTRRAQERARYRKTKDDSGSEDHPLIVDELDALGNDVASRKCMKRLRGHSVRGSLRRAEKRERRGSNPDYYSASV